MRIFEKDGKVNFVDENNVFVGYDLNQDCCEYADWFFSEREENKVPPDSGHDTVPPNLEGFRFDTHYFEELQNADDRDEGGMVRFKVTDGDRVVYLYLFNVHNGYYGHGFEAKIGGLDWKRGCL